MPVAPLVAAWDLPPHTGPVRPVMGGGPTLGTPILRNTLPGARMVVEIAWGAILTNPASSWLWYDETQGLLQGKGRLVTITMGRADETAQAAPASCTFTLDDSNGDYSPEHPLATHWPNVVTNTPVRVRVTVDGGTTWRVRFQGFANGFTPGFDTTGKHPVVVVSASGISRRLAQGKTPLASVMRTGALKASTLSSVAAYWPCEDADGARQVASGLPGGPPMQVLGTGTIDFASYTGFPGSAPMLVLGANTGLFGTVQAAPSTTGKVFFRSLMHMPPAASIPDGTLIWNIGMIGGSAAHWYVRYGTGGGLAVIGVAPGGGTTLADSTTWAFGVDDKRFYLAVELVQQGADISWLISVNILNADGSITALLPTGTFTGLTLGSAKDVSTGGSGNMAGVAIGHVGISNSQAWLFNSGQLLSGYIGETPRDRATRLCAENSVPFAGTGFYATDTTMGPQLIDTLPNLLRECEVTGDDFLYDGLSEGYTWQGISQRYDQQTSMALDMAAGDVGPPFAPVNDDQALRNLVRVNRKGGSSYTAEQTDGPLRTGRDGNGGIGVYDDDVTVNDANDSRLGFRALWEVHVGTQPRLRYPTLNLNLAASASVAVQWNDRLNGHNGIVLPGSRVDIVNANSVSPRHPPGTIALMLEGWTETIGTYTWDVACNCRPNSIYDVFKIEDTDLGRVQTNGSNVFADAAAGATSLQVATRTGSVVWTTTAQYPTDFPFYIEVDGIKVKVTAITGASSPQTFTVDGATVTKPLLLGETVRRWGSSPVKF